MVRISLAHEAFQYDGVPVTATNIVNFINGIARDVPATVVNADSNFATIRTQNHGDWVILTGQWIVFNEERNPLRVTSTNPAPAMPNPHWASDSGANQDGQVWYRHDIHELRCRVNGQVVTLYPPSAGGAPSGVIGQAGGWFVAGLGTVAGTYTNNRLSAIPIDVALPETISMLALNLATAPTTGTLRFAIYNTNSDGLPGALLYEGSLVNPTAGIKTVSPNLALQAGRYWIAVGLGSTAGTPAITHTTCPHDDPRIRKSVAATPVAADFTGTTYAGAYFQTFTSLVTSAPANPFVISGTTNIYPRVFVRFA
jgi:hypothetical protein